ncbi:unnamed protein product [Rotaria socialis]|uniref:protein acetyllysine N-acetyltransferase n=1 Tax=Rotaria socialis TaxID=392032 RepID=A0A818CGK6_9BILA|nr:unnamed protein product [Rotaria socialis]CAF3383073.1 unnamed protein product [Rotaria socialis]CAF3427761.1 unnamed protein product [Rotaria socialis]CAF3471824.1 unnamed protein product [Rotaria socialis]CAF3480837.1 unnamed protein product [Rotaria socialis]
MAHTALNDEEIKEYFDNPEELDEKIKKLADLIRNAKHFVVYTGAGISTSAGINDFRGPTGVWTFRAKGILPPAQTVRNPEPTLTHMAFVELMRKNYLKFLVSQNCDGLHLKSGIPTNKIGELHGNSNCEACAKCGKVYYRQERVQNYEHKTWLTGYFCSTPDCNGRLRCTTVAFTQSMPDICLDRATRESEICDLSLCMGTSMRVAPACTLPAMNLKSGEKTMVIVNLQKTPYDDLCKLRIFARCDDVIRMVMKELNLTIPPYTDLKLWLNSEWLNDFEKNWPFRTVGDTSWFSGDI